MRAFTQFIQQLYSENQSQYPDGGQATIRDLRQKAMDLFLQKELPDKRLQGWQQSVLNKKVKTDYIQKLQPDPYRPLAEYFQCRVQDLHPTVLPVSNGWFISENQTVNVDNQGVITGSLLAAIRQYPDLVLPLLAHPSLEKENGLVALNEALFNDGAFVYVPDNVKVEKPMQIVSLMNTTDPLLVNNRHLIILGNNAELSVIQCDDSIQKESSFSNIVSEIYLGENAHLNYYKTENKDAASMLLNHVFVHQKSYSTFTST
ncbi:MAG: SufD family Fe-S cluster assembly protein, partial [Bacteroidales bacterium]|nr:SufD family Fe-S cluster assembly protein [Bacteroidales bacterium]